MCSVHKKSYNQGQYLLIRNIEELEKCTKGLKKEMLVYNQQRAAYSELPNIVQITINQQFDQKQRLVRWAVIRDTRIE